MPTILNAICTSFANLVLSAAGGKIHAEAPEDKNDFDPIIRFAVCSDSHINTAVDGRSFRIEKAIKLAYAIAEQNKKYKKLDAFLFNGDVTQDGRIDQFCGFNAVVNKYIKNETEILPLVAYCHDFRTMDVKTLAYFAKLSGKEPDYHKVINGFHFIGISSGGVDKIYYKPEQRQWLKTQLEAAVSDDPNKPVFVSHHEHVKNTVYGSSDFDGWGTDFFTDILEEYPQVVDFSGHSHYPVNDPRSLWQGKFTAVGTGSLKYLEFTIKDKRCYHPEGYDDESQFWIVEADKDNRLRLRGIDVIREKLLCEYILKNPADISNREYTHEKQAKRSAKPFFESNTETGLNQTKDGAVLTFSSAKTGDSTPIFLYDVTVKNSAGETVKSEWVLAKYYSSESRKSEKLFLGKFPDGEYEVSITAQTAWGVRSNPLTSKIEFRHTS